MGLDSTIYVTTKELLNKEVDFYIEESSKSFAYFRKNSALHAWARDLYLSKGGTNAEFNGDTVVLPEKDIRTLQSLLSLGEVQGEAGFFWGTMTEDKYESIKSFTEAALTFYKNRENVNSVLYYNSSW